MSNNQEASIQKLNTLKNEYQMLSDKLSEMELELQEHQIVLEALIPLDPNRKSHRLIGGILVERTVEQVIPALKTNMEGVRLAIVDVRCHYNGVIID